MKVVVVWCGNGDGVNSAAHFVEHFAVVGEELRLRKVVANADHRLEAAAGGAGKFSCIHDVHQGDNLETGATGAGSVCRAFSAGADAGKSRPCELSPRSAGNELKGKGSGGGLGGDAAELPPGNSILGQRHAEEFSKRLR